MSTGKLIKYLEKSEKDLAVDIAPKRKLVVCSDSKGRYIKDKAFTNTEKSILWFIHPGKTTGAIIEHVVGELDDIVKTHGPILLAIWTGTCDLTIKKESKFIDINNDVSPSDILRSYRILLTRIKHFGNEVKTVFLECPPLSIPIWNSSRGHKSPEVFTDNNTLLDSRIQELNIGIREINLSQDVRAPRFPCDVYKSRKSNKNHTTIKASYSLYKDGIHPGEVLSRAWLRKIVIVLIQEQCIN